MDTTLFVEWGEGLGMSKLKKKSRTNAKSVPRLLSMILSIVASLNYHTHNTAVRLVSQAKTKHLLKPQ